MPDEGTVIDEELKKLSNIASDLEISDKMRFQAIRIIAERDSHEALLVLLGLAANDRLSVNERDLALKKSRDIIKKGH
jgi:hypothetical protein